MEVRRIVYFFKIQIILTQELTISSPKKELKRQCYFIDGTFLFHLGLNSLSFVDILALCKGKAIFDFSNTLIYFLAEQNQQLV